MLSVVEHWIVKLSKNARIFQLVFLLKTSVNFWYEYERHTLCDSVVTWSKFSVYGSTLDRVICLPWVSTSRFFRHQPPPYNHTHLPWPSPKAVQQITTGVNLIDLHQMASKCQELHFRLEEREIKCCCISCCFASELSASMPSSYSSTLSMGTYLYVFRRVIFVSVHTFMETPL